MVTIGWRSPPWHLLMLMKSPKSFTQDPIWGTQLSKDTTFFLLNFKWYDINLCSWLQKSQDFVSWLSCHQKKHIVILNWLLKLFISFVRLRSKVSFFSTYDLEVFFSSFMPHLRWDQMMINLYTCDSMSWWSFLQIDKPCWLCWHGLRCQN